MYLIFMRHGEAVPQTEDVPNRERRLTKEGKKQVRTTSRMLARFLKDRPLRIFASPFMRTRRQRDEAPPPLRPRKKAYCPPSR